MYFIYRPIYLHADKRESLIDTGLSHSKACKQSEEKEVKGRQFEKCDI